MRRFLPELEEETADREAKAGPLSIKGTEGMVVTLARCCHPIPGDQIVGYLSTGRGLVIHLDNCRNLGEYKSQPDKWIEVQWDDTTGREFQVEIRVDVQNQRGVLATVAAAIADQGSNIEQVNVQERDGATSVLNFLFAVRDRKHLATIVRSIRHLSPVMRISRVRS